MKIKKLADRLIKNGFIYYLIKRNDKVALYEQWEKTKEGEKTTNHWEVFKIRTTEYRAAMERLAVVKGKPCDTGQYEERAERFPGDEDFGNTAWTFMTLEKAEARFEALTLASEAAP